MNARLTGGHTVAVTLADGREVKLYIHTGHTAKLAAKNFDQAVKDAQEIVDNINAAHDAVKG